MTRFLHLRHVRRLSKPFSWAARVPFFGVCALDALRYCTFRLWAPPMLVRGLVRCFVAGVAPPPSTAPRCLPPLPLLPVVFKGVRAGSVGGGGQALRMLYNTDGVFRRMQYGQAWIGP